MTRQVFGRAWAPPWAVPWKKPGAGAAPRYMIASNRFHWPTDFGTNDSNYASGADPVGSAGGNGTSLTKYLFRRFKFSTTWAPKAGKFLFPNSVGVSYGVVKSAFSLTIQRVEIRTLAGALVDTVKFSGSGSRTIAPAEDVWSDAVVDLAANSTYYLDFWYTAPAHAAYPVYPNWHVEGETSKDSLNTDLSLSAAPTTGVSFAVGGQYGPAAFVAQGWDGSPVPLIVGDSIADLTFASAYLAPARGDTGFIQEAFGASAGGSWNSFSVARYSASFPGEYLDAQDVVARGGGTTNGAIARLKAVKEAFALLQSTPPFNVVVCEHGRNNLGNGTPLATMQGFLTALQSFVRGYWPKMPFVQLTTTPYTNAASNTAWTTEADQTPVNAANGAGGTIQQWNNWIAAGCGGTAVGIDSAAPCRGADYGKWAVPSFSAVVSTAIAANTTYSVHLSSAPAPGESLVFEPGVANVETSNGAKPYAAAAITTNAGGGWNVTLIAGRASLHTPFGASSASRVVKAHAVGSAVAACSSSDGLHPSPARQKDMTAVIVASKAAIAAAVASAGA